MKCPNLVGLLVLALAAAPAAAQSYRFKVLPTAGTLINGINDTGAMVVDTNQNCTIMQGTVATVINVPNPRTSAWCTGISNDGMVAGYILNPGATTTGFLKGPTQTGLSITRNPVYGATPYGISASKRWLSGVYYDTSGIFHGYTIVDGRVRTFQAPGATNTYPGGINDGAASVMYSTDVNYNVHNYLRRAGTFTEIEYPGAALTFLLNINDRGIVVGYYYDATYHAHGMVYDSRKKIFYTVDVPNATSTRWFAINNGNTLVGDCIPANASSSYGAIGIGTLPN